MIKSSLDAYRSILATSALLAVFACSDDDATQGTNGAEATGTGVAETTGNEPSNEAATQVEVTTLDDDTSPGVDPLDGRWEERASLGEGPRQEVGVVVAAGRVWMLGGLINAQVLARVEAYDPATDHWTSYPDLPVPMHHPNVAALSDRIVVAGFLRGTEFAADGTVYWFDLDRQVWDVGESMPSGTERGASATIALDGLVYVIGGRREGVAVTDAWTYEPNSGVWAPIADLPAPRDHMVIAVVDNRIYVIGGRDGAISAHTDRVDVYDPATDAWSSAAPMPTSRAGMAAGVLNNLIFVAGGEGNEAHPMGIFEELEVYDPATNAWTSLPPMPTPRHGTAGAVIDRTFYVPGGANVEGGGAVDTHEAWVVHP